MDTRILTVLLFLAIAVMSLVLPLSFVTQLGYIGLNALVCLGLVLLTGVAGLTSFGQAAFVGLGAYTTAMLTLRLGFSPWMSLPFSLGITAAVGWVLGMLTIRMSGHYLVLGTLAWGLTLFYLFGTLPPLGGYNGLADLPGLSLFGYQLDTQRGFAVTIWLLLGAIVVGLTNILSGRVGRAMRSLRASTMAESVGVDTGKLKIRVFILAAVLAALAGWLQAHYLRVVGPSSYSMNMSLEYLFMTVIGGSSHLAGALIGPTIFEFMRTGLRDYIPLLTGSSGNYEMAIFGIFVVVLLQFASGGIVGVIAPWLPKRVVSASPDAKPLPSRQSRPETGQELLKVQGLSKRFGGLVAVNDVSFGVGAREIVALIGPNGAGKSTLFNLVTGTLPPSAGRVSLLGREVQNEPARKIARHGVARTFQHAYLRPNMSVLENVALGAHGRTQAGMLSALFSLDRKEESQILAEASRQLRRVGLEELSSRPASTLALGQKRLVEIARALAADPIVLLLDEPAAGLRQHEKETLAALLRQLRAEGVTILIVEHDMGFVMDIADRIVVLEFGTKIADGVPSVIQADPKVIEAYLGPSE